MREEASDVYRKAIIATRKEFDAEIALAQLRALLSYLQGRARLYASLARDVNVLVNELESQAEDLRKGHYGQPRLALSVEVFETLHEPKERIWDRVYEYLFVRSGRYLRTFERSMLAASIAVQLKPEVGPDGRISRKPVDKIVSDLRDALLKLGREKLSPGIYGDRANAGLDLRSALEIEARLQLANADVPPLGVSASQIEDYFTKKFHALAQITGIMGRVDLDTWQSRGDGVPVDKLRYLAQGLGTSDAFVEKLNQFWRPEADT